MKETRKAKTYLYLAFAAIAICLVMSVTYAAYVASSYEKRTVSTWKDTTNFFSSNYMESLDYSLSNYSTVGITHGDGNVSLTVLVCNYNRMNPGAFSISNIGYSFIVTVCDADGVADTALDSYTDFRVAAGTGASVPMSGNTMTLSNQTLTGGQQSYNSYTITFPGDFEGLMKLEAVPDSGSLSITDNQKLGCFITASVIDRTVEQNWTGRLVGLENVTGNDEVDGFNYDISGSGAGTYTLTWDTTHVDISKWNLADYNITPTGSGSTKSAQLTLPFEDDDMFHTYHLQFYRTAPQASGESAAAWSTWITFTETVSDNND